MLTNNLGSDGKYVDTRVLAVTDRKDAQVNGTDKSEENE